MDKILIFAGTTEGRVLWEYCYDHNIPVTAAVATGYGESVLSPNDLSDILVGRMDRPQMEELLFGSGYKLVIDATHPYAKEVTENIKAACMKCQIPYIRVLRESVKTPGVIYVETLKEAADYLNSREGIALITTGSKGLRVFSEIKDYKKRLMVRILPDYENLKQCTELGFTGGNIICMQGPFSEEFNLALLKELKASYLVTKEAGSAGGFMEKVQAAKKAGAEVIVIRRPNEAAGFTLQKVMEELKELCRGTHIGV
ncbi:MAG: precorrin-6A reductase [Anaerocolumna sp.]